MFTTEFALAAFERALKTFAQALLAIVAVDGLGITDIDWQNALSVSLLAALASVLTSIVSSRIGNDSPSLATEALGSETVAVDGDVEDWDGE